MAASDAYEAKGRSVSLDYRNKSISTAENSGSSPVTRHQNIDIDNPLRGVDLKSAINAFVARTGLDDIAHLLLRGARVAEDPDNYDRVQGLTAADKAALEREYDEVKPWKVFKRMPKALCTIYLMASMAAITQGWDQSSINGANQAWPTALGLDQKAGIGNVWLFGFINASPFFFASVIGAWLSDPLNEYLMGRRAAIFVAGLFSLCSVIGCACCRTWAQLLVCRILLGVGMGCKAAVVPIYTSETAPTNIRGGLVMNWQLSVAFGTVCGFSMNLAMFDIGPLNWRLDLAAAALPTIPLLVLIFVCPESPRFLIRKQRWREAFKSLRELNETEVQAARELYVIYLQNELTSIKWYGKEDSDRLVRQIFPTVTDDENGSVVIGRESLDSVPKFDLNRKVNTYFKRILQLFTVPRIRRATVAASVVMISQQLCGVNIIAFYSSTILPPPNKVDPAAVRESQLTSLWLSWGAGVVGVIFAIPAFFTIDRWGRRTLTLWTTPLLGMCLFIGGLCFLLEPGSSAYIGSIFFFIFLFKAIYPPGLGVVPFTYSAEVFPIVNREAGMSLAVFINLFGAGCLGLFVPFIQSSLGGIGLFELFAGLNILAWILVFVYVYETKQERLEKLDRIFEVNCATHFKYQMSYVIPWCMNNLFRRDREPMDTLVLWASNQRTKDEELKH